MADVTVRLEASRAAVDEMIRVIERSESGWSTPRAEGKWSPSQVVEHVARSLEEGAHVVAGRPSKFPTLPIFARPVLRALLFNRVLRQGRFPKARTNKALNPAIDVSPATPADGIKRLGEACDSFERECRASAQVRERLTTGTFGPIALADYVRFTELHTQHHRMQMPMAHDTTGPTSSGEFPRQESKL